MLLVYDHKLKSLSVEHNFLNILLFSVAALCGTFARYGLSTLIQKLMGPKLPWGIFVVNILGCFGFGLFWAMSENLALLHVNTKAIILLGFMSAFTTFSTFIFDCDTLMREGRYLSVGFNILGQVILGLAAFILAVKLVTS